MSCANCAREASLSCLKLDEMHQNLAQSGWEDADKINRQRADLQNMRVEVPRDAD